MMAIHGCMSAKLELGLFKTLVDGKCMHALCGCVLHIFQMWSEVVKGLVQGRAAGR